MTTLTISIENTKKLNLIKELLQVLKIKFEISNHEMDTAMTEKDFIKKIEKARKSKIVAVCTSDSEIEHFIDTI